MEKIKRSFNASEKTYDENCNVQLTIGDNLLKLVQQHRHHASRIIDLGCGTGIITQRLASAFNYHDFHAIDIAELLLKKAKSRLVMPRMHVYAVNFNKIPDYDTPFDIIFSNMALHWSTCLISTLTQLSKLTKTESLLAFSLPLPGTFQELESHYAHNYFFDSAFIKEILLCCGYNVIVNDRENITLHFNNATSALRSIKNTGANHVVERGHRGLRGKSFIKQSALQQLTYVIGYFIAIKGNTDANQIIRHRNRHRRR